MSKRIINQPDPQITYEFTQAEFKAMLGIEERGAVYMVSTVLGRIVVFVSSK